MVLNYYTSAHVSSSLGGMSAAEFAAWLHRQLQRREWNLSDLGRKADVKPSVVSRWSRGERVPSPESCERIADALGLPLDEVLAAAGHRYGDERFGPDDPRAALWKVARDVRWTDERVKQLEAIMRWWNDYDKEHGLALKRRGNGQ